MTITIGERIVAINKRLDSIDRKLDALREDLVNSILRELDVNAIQGNTEMRALRTQIQALRNDLRRMERAQVGYGQPSEASPPGHR